MPASWAALSADAAAEGEGLSGISLWEKERKFVATDTKSKVGSAQRLAQVVGREPQNLVALRMTVLIVHVLQVPEIKHHHG